MMKKILKKQPIQINKKKKSTKEQERVEKVTAIENNNKSINKKVEEQEEVHLTSILEVFLKPNTPVEDLLYWVNFKIMKPKKNESDEDGAQDSDENDKDESCLFKTNVSFQPILTMENIKENASSSPPPPSSPPSSLPPPSSSSSSSSSTTTPSSPVLPPLPSSFSSFTLMSPTTATTNDIIPSISNSLQSIAADIHISDMISSMFMMDLGKDETAQEEEDMSSESSSWWTNTYSGKEVPLDDTSTDWAIWLSYNYEVKKYAFETEHEARSALDSWSFSNILTYNNTDDEGSVSLVDSDWAVWIYEYITVKRYGFKTELHARKALDEWYSVRILTYKEEEVAARCRYNSESMNAIRNAMNDFKVGQSPASSDIDRSSTSSTASIPYVF
eukprot:CAMPEP_0114334100 /NCGR_PEP_ID=MMETSP0101-20121206/4158_1 /TAXON_ID=38822 ORGANISM="Pteridomonas danica, Strain PT" /NCGR_SAMPLE_ID=MMETSP0101 /ASSEMBLY_ACC=CAM_ASM_000211 /LENGTH=387 /DNA_ID=CAMNT_0001465263 /DNA_START=857 /DNA_END=2020 /DNA_ORIENTATION=+